MAVPKKIINFLEKSKIRYKILKHKKVFTAFDKSQTLKVSPNIVAKTLVLKIDKNLFFVLIPADKRLDFKKLKKLGKKISLLSEKLIKKKIKNTKMGAIPPFGNLWKVVTIADSSFKTKRKIILNSGDWEHSIEISPKSLKKLIPDLIWQKVSIKK